MKLSDEDKKEPLKMEILKSETFLLETKYVNIEETKMMSGQIYKPFLKNCYCEPCLKMKYFTGRIILR